MLALNVEPALLAHACADLDAAVEKVGFFLANYVVDARALELVEWYVVPPEGYERQGEYFVGLTDDAKTRAIQRAWRSGSCLVEAHSHGDLVPAEFSTTDLHGFDDWVPHVWWRLRGRPYAAVVVAGSTIDALAWVDGPHYPEIVSRIGTPEAHLTPTGRTMARLLRSTEAAR